MPHLIVELSKELVVDEEMLLTKLNTTILDSGLFQSQDIKSRVYRTSSSLIGLGAECDGKHFAFANILLLSGRTPETKSALTASVLQALQDIISTQYQEVQYAVDIQDLSSHYQKAIR